MKKLWIFVFSLIIFSGISGGNFYYKIEAASFGEKLVAENITATSIYVLFTQSDVGIRAPYELLLVDLDKSDATNEYQVKKLTKNDIFYNLLTDRYEGRIYFSNLKPGSDYKITLLVEGSSVADELIFKTKNSDNIIPIHDEKIFLNSVTDTSVDLKISGLETVSDVIYWVGLYEDNRLIVDDGIKKIEIINGVIPSLKFNNLSPGVKYFVNLNKFTGAINAYPEVLSGFSFTTTTSISPSNYDFVCSATVDARSESVLIKVETKTNVNLWKIGVLDSTVKSYAGYANFENAIDYKGNTFSATYNFDRLKDGASYRTLIFSKEANKFAVELPNCNFTIPVIVDGVCGTAKGQIFSSTPKSNLCKSGTPSPVKRNYNQWEWSCTGESGGKNSQTCIASVGGTTTTTTTTTDPVVDASSEGGGLVPDCPVDGCGFNELMTLINNVIKFLLFTVATPLAALVFVYAGIMLLTSGGSSEKMTTAKKIIKNLIIGYVVALAAWLVINTILTSEFLGYHGPTFLQDN